MGIVSRMSIRPQAQSESWAPTDDRWYYPGGSFYGASAPLGGGGGGGGDAAMRLITVQNCVRMRASTIARLPCHLMETDGRNKNRATGNPLYERLHSRPNEWMTAQEFWPMMEAFVCLRGNFYAYKIGLEGRPWQQLIPINDKVIETKQNDDYSIDYKIRFKTGDERFVPASKIFHVKGLTFDGINGVSPIEYARETIGTAMSGVTFLERYFSKGMHPGAVMETDKNMKVEAHKNAREAYQEKYSGLGKSHELMLIDDGMKIKFPEIKLIDAQFLEQMKLSEAQICALYRIPGMMVNSQDKAPTFASSESFMLFYTMYSIDAPIYEGAINRDLLTAEDRKRYYAKFELKGLQRGAFKDQMDGFATGIDKEIYNPNEVREILDMNPYDGGEVYKTRTSTTKDSGNDSGGQK